MQRRRRSGREADRTTRHGDGNAERVCRRQRHVCYGWRRGCSGWPTARRRRRRRRGARNVGGTRRRRRPRQGPRRNAESSVHPNATGTRPPTTRQTGHRQTGHRHASTRNALPCLPPSTGHAQSRPCPTLSQPSQAASMRCWREGCSYTACLGRWRGDQTPWRKDGSVVGRHDNDQARDRRFGEAHRRCRSVVHLAADIVAGTERSPKLRGRQRHRRSNRSIARINTASPISLAAMKLALEPRRRPRSRETRCASSERSWARTTWVVAAHKRGTRSLSILNDTRVWCSDDADRTCRRSRVHSARRRPM